MDKLIAVEELIKKAKDKGIDLGKGDPYNRLRYYTKIGWLPHMTRKKGEKGSTKGHYPLWVLERLELIEELKEQDLSNDEISKKLEVKSRMRDIVSAVASPDTRNRLIAYVSLLMLVLIFLSEFGIVPVGVTKSDVVEKAAQVKEVPTVIDSGESYVPSGQRRIFVSNKNVAINSKINVTFTTDYTPATRFWVGEVVPFRGFYIELDVPVAADTGFSWWVSN